MIDLVRLKAIMGSRTRGSGSDWDFVFYVSINDTIRDLNAQTRLDVALIDEDDPPTSIDLDSKYSGVFRDGVAYHMQKNATWARTSEEVSDIDYRRSMVDAAGMSVQDELDEEE